MIGETVSHYRILEELGHGAMGVVYLAEDLNLKRRVAIKTSLSNPGRFLREAQAASALSHAHIATIHDYGKTDKGQPYIVMEYVEGQTLADLLSKQSLSIPRSLQIVREVAEALSEAHRNGIIHRDIKPSNIAISERGVVKVLDFGLAKQLSLEESEDQRQRGGNTQTQEGSIIGTPMYFSPEQALGLPLDHRSDLFSLGAVLYECLGGTPAFPGDKPIEICAKVIRDEPVPLSQLNPAIADGVERVTVKALAKGVNDRYQSAGEFITDLQVLESNLSFRGSNQLPVDLTEPAPIPKPNQPARLGRFLPVALILILVLAGFAVWRFSREKPSSPSQIEQVRVVITGNITEASISPDGKYVAYVNDETGKQSVWLRQINTGADLQVVSPTAARYKGISFSPSGEYLFYLKTEGDSADLYQVSTFGGPSRRLASQVDTPVSFSPEGTHLTFVRYSADTHITTLLIANTDGSNERALAVLKEPQLFSRGGFYSSGPAWSPDGKIIAVPAYSVTDKTHREIILVNVADGSMNSIKPGNWSTIEKLVWLADGSGFLMNAAEAKSLLLQVWLVNREGNQARRITKDPSNYIGLSATKDSQTFLTTKIERDSSVWIQSGSTDSLTQLPSSRYLGATGIAWTPDEKLVLSSNITGTYAIWMMDPDGGNRKQITFNDGTNFEPEMSPDGRYIVYVAFEGRHPHLWRINADGTNAKQLTTGGDEDLPRFTPDGKWVVYHSINQARYNIRKVSIDGGEPVILVNETATQPDVSPDGKFIACFGRVRGGTSWKIIITSIESATNSLTFDLPPTVEPEWPGVRWAADGQSLTYVATAQGISNIWRQRLSGGEPKPVTIFKESRIFFFDWSRNDSKLVLVRGNDTRDLILVRDFLNSK